jgi:hypothetical protein
MKVGATDVDLEVLTPTHDDPYAASCITPESHSALLWIAALPGAVRAAAGVTYLCISFFVHGRCGALPHQDYALQRTFFNKRTGYSRAFL